MTTMDKLEASARLLCETAEKIQTENVRLERENKKLADQLQDALDEVFRLQRIVQASGVQA